MRLSGPARFILITSSLGLACGVARRVDESGAETSSGTSGDGDGDTDSTTTGEGDASSTGDGDPTTTGDGDGEPEICSESEFFPEYVPPNVMLVVDASSSMVAQSWDHDLDEDTPEVTRWASLRGVIESVMDQRGTAMYAGIQRFPGQAACDPSPCYDISACTTETTPEAGVGLDNGAAVLAAIPGANAGSEDIEGGTPTTKGVLSAVDHLLMQEQGEGNYIVLVTDGAANCNTALGFPDVLEVYDETLTARVEDAYINENITTFVVGIDILDQLTGVGADGAPEANPYERLNDVAIAGGAPKVELVRARESARVRARSRRVHEPRRLA